MSDDLKQRLRDPSVFVVSKKEAADRIEEYEQALANMQREYAKRGERIEELKKERDTYFAERNKFQLYLQRTHADWEIEVAAVDGLNAKLATASHNATEFGHKIVELEAELDKAWKTCLAATTKGMELEAKLKTAVGALGDIGDGEPEWPDDPARELAWCRKRANEAIAKINGEQP